MAQEGIDAVLAASVFEQEIVVLFMDEGVWQLHNHQQGGQLHTDPMKNPAERKNIAAQIQSFPLYDIEQIYIDETALDKFSIPADEILMNPHLANESMIRSLIKESSTVLTY